MSIYGESPYNEEKNRLLEEIQDFLKEHPISELMKIISDALAINEGNFWYNIIFHLYIIYLI